jgi:hypothetical protein
VGYFYVHVSLYFVQSCESQNENISRQELLFTPGGGGGGKEGRYVRLVTLLPIFAHCKEIIGTKTSWSPKGLSGQYRDS